jgi:hypothetical protein
MQLSLVKCSQRYIYQHRARDTGTGPKIRLIQTEKDGQPQANRAEIKVVTYYERESVEEDAEEVPTIITTTE